MTSAARAFLVVMLVGLALTAAIGWRRWSSGSTATHRPTTIVSGKLCWQAHIAVDVSGSTEAFRDKLMGLIDVLIAGIFPRDAQVDLWVFAQHAAEVYSGDPKRARDLWPVLDKHLADSAQGVGTYPGPLLEELLAEVRSQPSRNHVIVIAWDGENNGDDIALLVQQLAAEPQLRAVWVVGVISSVDDPNRNLRSRVKREFAALGQRVIVSGLEDRESGLTRLRDLVRASDR